MKFLPIASVLGLSLLSGQAAAGLVVDGNLSDWQINSSTWVSSLSGVHSTVEDSTGSGAYYLNPGWGGQAYDAEALYAVFQGNKLYVALVTGHSPTTANSPSANSYGAGDFAFDFGKNGSYELGVNVIAGNFGLAGGVYKNPTWAYGLWDSAGNHNESNPDPLHPTSLNGGVQIGSVQSVYTTTGVSGYGSQTSDLHYFYEFSIDLDLLTQAGWDGSAFNIHWTENCANDSIMVDPDRYVPEPGSLALFGLGFLGLLGARQRRR